MKNRSALVGRLVFGSVVLGGVLAIAAAGCGGATVESACAAYASATCAKVFECSPFLAALVYTDQAECEDVAPVACEPFLKLEDSASPDAVVACSNAYSATSCEDLYKGAVPDACLLKGLRPSGESCTTGIQCETGACEFATSDCGVCAKIAAAGEACPMGAPCEAGTYCSADEICTKYAAEGDNCGDTQLCDGATTCVNGACVPRGKEGDPCTLEANPCSTLLDGLVCNTMTNVCEAVKLASLGGDCGLVGEEYVYCKASSCVEGKCAAKLPEGADCGEGLADCDLTLDCVDGKCVQEEPAECN